MSKKYNISNKNKVKIALWAGVYALIMLCLLTLLFEGMGTAVGFILDRPAAASYLDKTYPDIETKFVRSEIVNEKRSVLGVAREYKAYRFYYKAKSVPEGKYGVLKNGDEFSIDAYNFKVTRDSVYMDYSIDKELLNEIDYTFLNELCAFAKAGKLSFEPFDAYIDIKVPYNKYESAAAAVASDEISKCDAVVHVTGEKVDFETYKAVVAPIAMFYEREGNEFKKPKNLQIFYYYKGDNGENVMQYESQLADYELLYEESAIVKGEGMHYKVELEESDSKKLKAYNTVKTVYIVVLSATFVVLYTLLTYKKIRKYMRQGNSL